MTANHENNCSLHCDLVWDEMRKSHSVCGQEKVRFDEIEIPI